MRITFVLPYAGLQGGIRVLSIYIERLRRRGHTISVVSEPQTIALKEKAKAFLLGRGIPGLEPSYLDSIDVPHKVLETVRPVTDQDVPDADVVVATYYTTAAGVLRLSPSKGAKAIFIQHYEVEEGRSNPALDATWRMPMHKITISKWLVDLARERFGDGSVSLVPNSVDLSQFSSEPREKAERPTIGFLYSTFSLKGTDIGLKALKRATSRLPSLRVVCFGAVRPTWKLPLPPGTDFHYRPPQNKIKDIYAQCDAWMCSSITEGFHLPLLEAMACRCPVVSTEVGGPMDLIENGTNGFLVPVKDHEALGDQLIRVLSFSNGEWQRMSDAALKTARRYSWDDAAALFEKALLVAVERNKNGDLQPRF